MLGVQITSRNCFFYLLQTQSACQNLVDQFDRLKYGAQAVLWVPIFVFTSWGCKEFNCGTMVPYPELKAAVLLWGGFEPWILVLWFVSHIFPNEILTDLGLGDLFTLQELMHDCNIPIDPISTMCDRFNVGGRLSSKSSSNALGKISSFCW